MGEKRVSNELTKAIRQSPTHILLLLVDVTDLKPDVDLGEGSWRVLKDVAEALGEFETWS